jgi:hypothetical protein
MVESGRTDDGVGSIRGRCQGRAPHARGGRRQGLLSGLDDLLQRQQRALARSRPLALVPRPAPGHKAATSARFLSHAQSKKGPHTML